MEATLESSPSTFDSRTLVHDAARVFAQRPGAFIGVALSFVVPMAILDTILSRLGGGMRTTFIDMMVGFVADAALTSVALAEMTGASETTAESLNHAARNLSRVLSVRFAAGLRILGGFLLLVVPGILASLRYSLVVPAALDPNASTEPLHASAELTQDRLGTLALAWLVALSPTLFFCMVAMVVVGPEDAPGTSEILVNALSVPFQAATIVGNVLVSSVAYVALARPTRSLPVEQIAEVFV